MKLDIITSSFEEHLQLAQSIKKFSSIIQEIGNLAIAVLEKDGVLFFAGNGGSAADSQHLAAEFTGRFKKERVSLPALALTVDTSALTAIANDYGYDHVFSRQLSGLGKKGDLFFAISTSGNSTNLIKAI
jgi:D-sedoheptulose 7-phosphate isomerase